MQQNASGQPAQATSGKRSLETDLELAVRTGELKLAGKNLHEFPASFGKQYALADTREVDLSRNRLQEVPKECTDLPNTEKLLLHHNTIRSIPECVVNLQSLQHLDLSRNQLSYLPAEVCQLGQLQSLIVNNNRLVSLPEEIGEMACLMQLDVSCNEIAHLPLQIGDLANLRHLNLRRNHLQEVPVELTYLQLSILDLSSNRISNLPVELRFMLTLVELDLSENPLSCPPANLCGRGRVHIFKYLETMAIKEDKKRGILADTEQRRSYRKTSQITDMRFGAAAGTDARLKRHTADSGYGSEQPVQARRWSSEVQDMTDSRHAAEDARKLAHRAISYRPAIHTASSHQAAPPVFSSGLPAPPVFSPPAFRNGPASNGSNSLVNCDDSRSSLQEKISLSSVDSLGPKDRSHSATDSGEGSSNSSLSSSGTARWGQQGEHSARWAPPPPPEATSSPAASPAHSTASSAAASRPPSAARKFKSELVSRSASSSTVQRNSASSLSHTSNNGILTKELRANSTDSVSSSSSFSVMHSNKSITHQNGAKFSRSDLLSGGGGGNINRRSPPDVSSHPRLATERPRQLPSTTAGRLPVPTNSSRHGSPRQSPTASPPPTSGIPSPTSGPPVPAAKPVLEPSPHQSGLPNRSLNHNNNNNVNHGTAMGMGKSASSFQTYRQFKEQQKLSRQAAADNGWSGSHDQSGKPSVVVRSYWERGGGGQNQNSSMTGSNGNNVNGSGPVHPPPAANHHAVDGVIAAAGGRFRNGTAVAGQTSTGGRTAIPTSNRAGLQPGRTGSGPNGYLSRDGSAPTGGKPIGHNPHDTHIHHLRQQIETRLKISLGDDLAACLTDGVILCHVVNHVSPRSVNSIHVPSPAVPKLSPAKCKRNVENFLAACRRIGVREDLICSSSDVLEPSKRNVVRVAVTVTELLRFKN